MSKVNGHCIMRLDRETPGAALYREVDEDGNSRIKDTDGALMAQNYMRKAALQKIFGHIPRRIRVTVEVEEEKS